MIELMQVQDLIIEKKDFRDFFGNRFAKATAMDDFSISYKWNMKILPNIFCFLDEKIKTQMNFEKKGEMK